MTRLEELVERLVELVADSLAGSDAEVTALRRSLEDRLGKPIESVDLRTVASIADTIPLRSALLDAMAPLTLRSSNPER